MRFWSGSGGRHSRTTLTISLGRNVQANSAQPSSLPPFTSPPSMGAAEGLSAWLLYKPRAGREIYGFFPEFSSSVRWLYGNNTSVRRAPALAAHTLSVAPSLNREGRYSRGLRKQAQARSYAKLAFIYNRNRSWIERAEHCLSTRAVSIKASAVSTPSDESPPIRTEPQQFQRSQCDDRCRTESPHARTGEPLCCGSGASYRPDQPAREPPEPEPTRSRSCRK